MCTVQMPHMCGGVREVFKCHRCWCDLYFCFRTWSRRARSTMCMYKCRVCVWEWGKSLNVVVADMTSISVQNLKQKSKERSLQSALYSVLEILNNLGHTFSYRIRWGDFYLLFCRYRTFFRINVRGFTFLNLIRYTVICLQYSVLFLQGLVETFSHL